MLVGRYVVLVLIAVVTFTGTNLLRRFALSALLTFYSVKLPRLMKTPGACVLNDNRIDFHDGTIYDVKAAMWYEM
ncbi:hypothetical protein F5B17DRAFT_394301 [Nemania serpens]|nr:hypothetical protein F5B17DRAFT_394301 [Nemania serpens]